MKVDATKKDVTDGFAWIEEELSDNPDEFGGVVIFISCHSNKKESIVLVDCDDFKIETVITPLRNKMNELRIGAEKSQLPLILIHQHCGGDKLYDFTWNDTFAYFACLADEKAIRSVTTDLSGAKTCNTFFFNSILDTFKAVENGKSVLELYDINTLMTRVSNDFKEATESISMKVNILQKSQANRRFYFCKETE